MSQGLSQNLALEFRRKIETGQWATGQRLPTSRELAATYQVSVNTIQSAFRFLEAHGLVDRRPRRGGFVKLPSARRGTDKATTVGFVGAFTPGPQEAGVGEWAQRILRGADEELVRAGYHPSLFSYVPEASDEVARLVAKIEQSAETLVGLVLFLSPAIYGLLDELDRREIPWVTINRPAEHAPHNYVMHDVFTAARVIGRCLARMNVSRVAVLSDPMRPGKSSSDKFFGLIQGYVERGMPSRNIDYVATDGNLEADGHARMAEYVDRHGVPGAVLAAGDLLALGTIRLLRERGVDVPARTGVIGSTGLRMSEYTHPPLTVINTPMERVGREAARMLLEMARRGTNRLIGRTIPAPVLARESFPIPPELLREESAGLVQPAVPGGAREAAAASSKEG
jgi:DNA-binding LacI/PurR family transcriptional regulator